MSFPVYLQNIYLPDLWSKLYTLETLPRCQPEAKYCSRFSFSFPNRQRCASSLYASVKLARTSRLCTLACNLTVSFNGDRFSSTVPVTLVRHINRFTQERKPIGGGRGNVGERLAQPVRRQSGLKTAPIAANRNVIVRRRCIIVTRLRWKQRVVGIEVIWVVCALASDREHSVALGDHLGSRIAARPPLRPVA